MTVEPVFEISQTHRMRNPSIWSETSNTPPHLVWKLEHQHFSQSWKGEVQLLQLKTAEAFCVKKEKHNWKLYVSLKTKINKTLAPSVCICTYYEIYFKELTVQLGNHSYLLLFEISLVFPVQLHLCVKLSPPGNPFCLPLGYLLLSACMASILNVKSLSSFANHTFVTTQSGLWLFVL